MDVFASSGGAVNALALVADHPEDVGTLVAHEPPVLTLLPDADRALAAEHDVQAAYHHNGFGAGMARVIAMTSWQGEFTDEYAAQPDPPSSACPRKTTAPATTRCCPGRATQSPATVPTAQALNQPLTEFPSHHGGFLGGEFGYAGEPAAFAARLRGVIDGTT